MQAYTPIVAGGKSAAILHYNKNDGDLPKDKNDFLLIDAGCEYKYYASDITRTYPINGKFSNEWKNIYNIVLNAQKAVLSMLKPGIAFGTCIVLHIALLAKDCKQLEFYWVNILLNII